MLRGGSGLGEMAYDSLSSLTSLWLSPLLNESTLLAGLQQRGQPYKREGPWLTDRLTDRLTDEVTTGGSDQSVSFEGSCVILWI